MMRARPIALKVLLMFFASSQLISCSVLSDGDDMMSDDLFDAELDNLPAESSYDSGSESSDMTDTSFADYDNSDSSGFGNFDSDSSGFGSLDSDSSGFGNFDSDALLTEYNDPMTTAETDIVTDDDMGSFPGPDMGLGADTGFGGDSGNSFAPPATSPMAPPAPTSAAAPDGSDGARVYYVASQGDLVDSPDGSNVVASVSTGDPVLVQVSGDWANVLDRGWIRSSQLSESPVGRQKPNLGWE